MRERKITTCPSRVNPLFCSFYIPDHKKQHYKNTPLNSKTSFLSAVRICLVKQTELLVAFYFANKSTNPGVPMDTHAFGMRILSAARCAYINPPVTTLEASSVGHSSATVRGNRDKSRQAPWRPVLLSFSFLTSVSFCTATVYVWSSASDAPLLRRPVYQRFTSPEQNHSRSVS